jgi:hypothetical protein
MTRKGKKDKVLNVSLKKILWFELLTNRSKKGLLYGFENPIFPLQFACQIKFPFEDFRYFVNRSIFSPGDARKSTLSRGFR